MVERYEFGQGHLEGELSGRWVSLDSFSIRFSSGNPRKQRCQCFGMRAERIAVTYTNVCSAEMFRSPGWYRFRMLFASYSAIGVPGFK